MDIIVVVVGLKETACGEGAGPKPRSTPRARSNDGVGFVMAYIVIIPRGRGVSWRVSIGHEGSVGAWAVDHLILMGP